MRTVLMLSIILCFVFILYICIIAIKNVFKKKRTLSINIIQDKDNVKISISDLGDNNKALREIILYPDKTFTNKFLDNTYSLQDNIVANLLSDNECIFNFPNISNTKYIIAVCTKATIEDYILHFFFSWFSEDKKYIIYCSDADNNQGLFQYSPATEIEIISSGNMIEDMSGMFSNCKFVNKINCKNLVTDKVRCINSMFSGCSELEELNLDNWDTSSITNMSYMFAKCNNLKELNLDNWDTSSVTNMEFMFWRCSSLTNISLSHFNTRNVQNMRGMFVGCIDLLELDLSNFNTSNVVNIEGMFKNCESLTSLNLSHFDFRGIQYSISEMFLNCGAINIICPGNIMGNCHNNQAIGTINGINSADYELSNDIYNFYCRKGSNNYLYVIQYNRL